MVFCSYGCGKEAKFQLKNGKWCCNKFWTQCDAIRKKNTEGLLKLGENHPMRRPEVIKNFKEKVTGKKRKPLSKYHKKRIGEGGRGKKRSQETRKLLSVINTGNKNPNFGKVSHRRGKTNLEEYGSEKAREIKSKISRSVIKLWNNPNSIYHTLEYWKKRAISENAKPNLLETKILSIVEKNLVNWEYCGNYSFWIGNQNPDFINKEKKKVIEFFGNHYHDKLFRQKFRSDNLDNKEHEKQRTEKYKKYGYDCLVIWEQDLKDIREVEKKIIEFELGEKINE